MMWLCFVRGGGLGHFWDNAYCWIPFGKTTASLSQLDIAPSGLLLGYSLGLV
jgi:hypothetical protein